MPKVKRNKTTLRKAAKLLQAAHDRIEVVGFNINTYGPPNPLYSPVAVADEFGGACCYIGNLRLLAGCEQLGPEYVYDDDGAYLGTDPGAGDGPELYLALEAMDTVAKRRLPRWGGRVERVEEEYGYGRTGRFVETLGFKVRERFEWDPRYRNDIQARQKAEANYALRLLRTALTDIYKEVEAI